MSGGVDSSVSALLLKEQGYEVIGLTMKLWEKNSDENDTTISDAKKICDKIRIEHHVENLQDEFRRKVVDNFVSTYLCGKTPNPCVECNKFIKFGEFYKLAKKYNCKYIATGHYAKITYSKELEQYVLCKSKAEEKDQTYFLYGIDKEILPYIIFPLADFSSKDEIRKIASEAGLEVAKKKDSQEICFIENNNYVEFLEKYKNNEKHEKLERKINGNNIDQNNKQGNFVLKSGKILGNHEGIMNYTIGQRKGLGISYKEPLYVIKLDTQKNEVVLGTEEELYTNSLMADELNFLLDLDKIRTMYNKENNKDKYIEIEVDAKVRYRSKPAKAILKLAQNEDDDKRCIAKLEFKEPQRAITPGQSVVFYINDMVLGGGKII